MSATSQPAVEPKFSAIEIADRLKQHRPTPEQAAIIEAPLESMLVVAGAGSGKTETMAGRVVWLVANELVAPEQVLGLTFTRKAAGELTERISKRLRSLRHSFASDQRDLGHGKGLISLDVLDRPTVSTYNSYAASLVTDHGLRIGVEPGSQLLTEAGQWQLASHIVESYESDLNTDKQVGTVTEAVLKLANAINEHLTSPDDVSAWLSGRVADISALPFGARKRTLNADVKALLASLELRQKLMSLVTEYNAAKREREYLDFSDQIALAARLSTEIPDVGEGERSRFAVVLLDEYQDTSHAQTTFLRALYGGGHPVIAVGDPNQSIYGWRGASASGLARFPAQFATSAGVPAQVRQLATTWRNDQLILDAANAIAEPLRQAAPDGQVAELKSRPGAGPGYLQGHVAMTTQTEAEKIADFIEEHWRPRTEVAAGAGAQAGGSVSAAILCRARAQFPRLEAALKARGIPVEVVGLGGLLSTPEITDLVAFLEVVHDPSRGDSLMRLLTGPWLNLGAKDVHGLAAWARHLDKRDMAMAHAASPSDAQGVGGRAAVESDATDAADGRSIVDALDDLADNRGSDSVDISADGRDRLGMLAGVLRQIRSLTYLPLAELLDYAERALGLDIETALARGGKTPRAHLDEFRGVARSFTGVTQSASLGSFLAWLASAMSHEKGLDRPLDEPNPDAVQIITIHGSKGLEWDVVAIPGLLDGKFPSTKTVEKPPTEKAWLIDISALPYPLRGDSKDLPSVDLSSAEAASDLAEELKSFAGRAGEYAVLEERRLAYVAITRARSKLLLTAAWWRDGVTSPGKLSLFFTDLMAAGLVEPDEDSVSPDAVGSDNPLDEEIPTLWWPRREDHEEKSDGIDRGAALHRSADLVNAALRGDLPALSDTPPGVQELAELGDLLLIERRNRAEQHAIVAAPSHLSASSLVRIAQDRSEFELSLRRPVPQAPSTAAQRGTALHAWIEQFYESPSLIDVDSVLFDSRSDDAVDSQRPGEPGVLDDTERAALAKLQEAFEASTWAHRTPIAIEEDIDTILGDVIARTRIDAVFQDPESPGSVVVVDWKSGRAPSDPEQIRAREVQLAVYRLAWARATGTPLDQVGAAFHYVPDNQTVRPQRLLSEGELEELIKSIGS